MEILRFCGKFTLAFCGLCDFGRENGGYLLFCRKSVPRMSRYEGHGRHGEAVTDKALKDCRTPSGKPCRGRRPRRSVQRMRHLLRPPHPKPLLKREGERCRRRRWRFSPEGMAQPCGLQPRTVPFQGGKGDGTSLAIPLQVDFKEAPAGDGRVFCASVQYGKRREKGPAETVVFVYCGTRENGIQ